MADYIDALRQGLAAADVAEAARCEIEDIFSDLDRQVREVSDGKIAIERRRFERELNYMANLALSIANALNPQPKDYYWAVAAYNPTIPDSTKKQLARWKQDRAGYPCTLSWGDKEFICEDRESLENSLEELLRDPIVGEALQALMKLEPPLPEENLEHQEGEASDESASC